VTAGLGADEVFTVSTNAGEFRLGDIEGLGDEMYIEGGYSGAFSMYTGGVRGLHMNSNGRIVVNGTTEPIGGSAKLSVNGNIYATAVYVGNGLNNYISSYNGSMLIYAQSGNTIFLGGGVGNRQNNVSVGNGYLQVDNNGDPAAFTVNVFPFTSVANSPYTPDAIIASKSTSNTAGTLLLHSRDTTIAAGQVIGVLQYGGRDDSSNSYISSQIIGEVKNAPNTGSGGGGILKLQTATSTTGSNPSTRVLIDNNGNVGIGTANTTPLAKLHVDGGTYIREDVAMAKTGAIGTSNMFSIDYANENIYIGDENDYFGGSKFFYDVSHSKAEFQKTSVGFGITPTELVHIHGGILYLDKTQIKDNNAGTGLGGQVLGTSNGNNTEWQWIPQTLTSAFYHSSSATSIIYMPIGGTLSETTSNQYYNNFVAPADGRVRQIRIKHISGTTPSATSFASFRVYVNGSLVSSLTPTTTNGGSTGMMGVRRFTDTQATFSEGDRVQFAFVTTGGGRLMYGCAATFLIEYTETTDLNTP